MTQAVSELDRQFASSAAVGKASPTVWPYYLLFFISGCPALLYQIVWQRTLFTLFGVNIESVTVVVSVFMLGLGLGSLAGGLLSARRNVRLLAAFGAIELCIGTFGAFSLPIFHRVAAVTAGGSLLKTGLVAFVLLLVPTLLMGSTLPLLSEHFVRRTGNVGESVGLLYSVNTLGSALACLIASLFLMRMLGQSGSIALAASLNCLVGLSALALQLLPNSAVAAAKPSAHRPRQQTIPFPLGMFLAGAAGFIALAYEILWYRYYSFATGGTAHAFADLLAFYLFGVAYGSRAVRQACRKKLGNDIQRTMAAGAEVVLIGAIAAYVVGPVLGIWVSHILYVPPVFVFVAATLLGAAFPLVAHAAIDPAQNVGRGVSLIYLSNIIGSTLGSFVVGFWVLDRFSSRATSLMLLSLGLLLAILFARFARNTLRRRAFLIECAICVLLLLFSRPLFFRMYERFQFKTGSQSQTFSSLVENRSGVISTLKTTFSDGSPTEIVFGGGVYDGRFNVDLMHDANGIFRVAALSGMHPNPRHVLMVGLASGSWAQLVANEPGVEDLTIVEINPGYLPLIRNHAAVASLLHNPKVHIVIDDGRRWLVGHPDRRFDMIVMNTTFHWRANVSNLLSVEFLRLARRHLSTGGILYYNSTWGTDVLATGAREYPYALRVNNFLALSDASFTLDKARWRAALPAYRIDGHRLLDPSDPAQSAKIEQLVSLADQLDKPNGELESRASMLQRLKAVRSITDDNMGAEW